MSVADQSVTTADEQLREAVRELAEAAHLAGAQLRATVDAVHASSRDRIARLERSVEEIRASKERAAVDEHDARAAQLARRLLDLPPPATLSFDMPGWEDLVTGAPVRAPSVLRIGELVTATGASVTEALVPNPALANLTLRGAGSDRDLLVGVIESLLVRVLAAPPRGGVHVHVLDPHHNGTTLSRFGTANTTSGGVFEPVAVTVHDIRTRLDHLAQRVSTVAQRFLQGSHRSLGEYNAVADVPEAHHLVVALDVSEYGTSELGQLAVLSRTGAPCGVHVLTLTDGEAPRRHHGHAVAVEDAPGGLVARHGRIRLAGIVGPHQVLVEPAPPTELVRRVVTAAESRAREGAASAVLLTDLLTSVPRWATRPGATISAPIGRSGGGAYEFALDVKGNGGVHALVAGMTGMGKSTLLHSVICALAHRYSPEDLNFYLVDGKDGVEFRSYAPQRSEPAALPHARVVAVKSDIEMYLSVLDELDEERRRRSQVFADHEVTDIVELAEECPGIRMPRIVAVLDEFHVLLADDKHGERAAGMLNALAKQGRNAGIHLVLATQSLTNLGAMGANKGLFDQIGLRIALKTKDGQSSATILGEGNEAAARLTRRGEAIANSTGDRTQNEPLQVALVDKAARARLKRELAAAAPRSAPPFVFDGSGLAPLSSSRPLMDALTGDAPALPGGDTRIWLGAPVEVAPTVHADLSDRRGSNLAVVGSGRRDERDIYGVLAGAALSAAVQHRSARFVLIPPRPDHASHSAVLALAAALTAATSARGSVEVVPVNEAYRRLAELGEESAAADGPAPRRTFVVAFGAARIVEPGAFAPVVATGADTGVHLFAAWPSCAELAAGVLAPTGYGSSASKALADFEVRVVAQVTGDDQMSLGLGRRTAPEADRMVLWSRAEPNRLTGLIPFDAPGTAGWDAVLAAAGVITTNSSSPTRGVPGQEA